MSVTFDKGEMDPVKSAFNSSDSASGYNKDCAISSKEVEQAILH